MTEARGAEAAASERLSNRWPVYTRVALGLSSGALPGLLLLLLGVALGPQGIGLLSAGVLAVIDPAMPVALVALGILIGLSFNPRRSGDTRLLGAASMEAALTTAVVVAGTMLAAPAWDAMDGVPSWFVAVVLGVCAASSSAVSSRNRNDVHSLSARIGDLDDLLPIVVGGVALAFYREPSPVAAGLVLLAHGCGVALVIVTAGWLLLARSSSETEQRVFTIALLLLLGGAADYLSLSALLSGLIAGLFLEWIGGPARDYVRRDVLHMQHPLLVLVLLVAGARIEIAATWIVLGVAFLFLRTAGKLAGGWMARRMAGPDTPKDLGLALLSPGILGIAFVINVLRAAGPDAAPLLTVVAVGAIASDVIGALVRPREAGE